MERVEQYRSVKVDNCTLFSFQRSVTFDFMFHTTFHKVRMRKEEFVRKIAQKCEKQIYGES